MSVKSTVERMRSGHLIAVGLLVTVGLFLVLTAQAGFTAAASGTPDASSSVSVQGKVRIHLRGYLSGPQFAAVGRGRFTVSGAISDRGRFVDEFQGIHPPNGQHVLTLRGAKGTIQIMVDARGCNVASSTCVSQWRVTKGTKAYAGLRGRGTAQGQYRSIGIDFTMTGTVSQ